jgi:hypothetical protein
MSADFYTLAGIAGTAMVIFAFFATQQEWLSAQSRRYQVLNLVGACLIMLSLYQDWNLPAFLIEVFWAAISVYGLLRHAFGGGLRSSRAP